MTLTIHESGAIGAPTIVFLHGLGVSSWMWEEQINALSASHHCLAIDLPGSGESYQAEWVSFADSAEQVAQIIRERATAGVAHVVGLSLGGYVALHLLAQTPELVTTAIISGITTRPFKRAWLVMPLVKVMKHMMQWDWLLKMNAKAMQMPDEVVPLFQRDGKRLAPNTIQRVYAEVLHIELPPNLSQITRPLLMVAGEKEAKQVLESLPDLPALTPTAVAAQAPGVHHGWNAEAPDLFTDMVRQWVTHQQLPEKLALIAGDLPSVASAQTMPVFEN